MIGKLGRGISPLAFQDIIETGTGVLRRVLPARKDDANPLLAPERPWEGRALIVPSVCREPATGPWRMWYAAHGVIPKRSILCYAESDDGRLWRRPDLGLVEFQGSKANNIVLIEEMDAISVYLDLTAAPEERYRLFSDCKAGTANGGYVFTMASADGLRWRMRHDRMIPVRNDSQNTGLKDPYTGKWICYHRPGHLVRTVARSESPDGKTWGVIRQVMTPDTFDQLQGFEHYAIAVFPYDGGFLGLLRIYDTRWDRLTSWVEAVVSRDGIRWQRLPDRTPLVGLGPDGAWDSRLITPGHALVEEGAGHWFFYDSWNARHDAELGEPHARSCIGRAFIPRRRFFECAAQREKSTLTTHPLLLEGDALLLDALSPLPGIRASLSLCDGTTPAGFAATDSTALTGDVHSGRIDFAGGSLSRFAGQPVRITLHMPRGSSAFGMGCA